MTESTEFKKWPQRTTQFHIVPCLYLADPATFLASNSVLWILFSSDNSLFIQLRGKKKLSPHLYLNYLNSEFEYHLKKHVPL